MTYSARIAIIIPARYGSTRFPGKPLAPLAGRSVLAHVIELARKAASGWGETGVYVTTDDDRIAQAAGAEGVEVLLTPAECPTGTDRVMAAAQQLAEKPDLIINLQGDAPLTPPDFITAMIETYHRHRGEIVTPVVRLSWDELDALRESKKTTPFSGTTVTMNAQGRALWFSKTIIPAIRKETELRSGPCPVFRHIGVYGYEYAALERYVSLPPGRYEELEGLEQLRALENGMTIQCVEVDYQGRPAMTGIDSPEDLQRAEALLQR